MSNGGTEKEQGERCECRHASSTDIGSRCLLCCILLYPGYPRAPGSGLAFFSSVSGLRINKTKQYPGTRVRDQVKQGA
eukprot:3029129-Rhodomonas_salina.1